MSKKYYCKIKGSILGPFTASQLKDHAKSGKLVPDSLIRLEGTDRWIEAYKFKNFEFPETIKPHQYAPPVAGSSQNHAPYVCTQCGLELGMLKGLEGKKILCQHCKKITLVVAPKPVANQFESNVSANLPSADVYQEDTAEVDFTPEPAWKNQKHHSQTRGYKANNPKSGSGVIYVIFGACIVGGLLLLILGVGITTLVGRPGPEKFRATAEKISVGGIPQPPNDPAIQKQEEDSIATQRIKAERDREEKRFKEAEVALQEFAKREMDLLRNDPSLLKSYSFRSDITIPPVGKNAFNQFETTRLESTNQAFIKYILQPNHNAFMDSSYGDKVLKGRIFINGKREATFNNIKFPDASFTLKFECVYNGFSWKVVSATRS